MKLPDDEEEGPLTFRGRGDSGSSTEEVKTVVLKRNNGKEKAGDPEEGMGFLVLFIQQTF